MLPLYTDQLDSERRNVLAKLASFAKDFTLAGGTAMMLQIGHRKSFDFDCFSPHDLSPYLLPKAKRILGKNMRIKFQSKEIITIITPNGIEVTFAWYPYKNLRPTVKTPSLPLYHLDDLATNKALTIGRRPAWRDYVDLFILLKWKLYTLSDIILLSEKKFQGEFNDKLFLKQLTYYDDVAIAETMFLKDSYTPKQVQTFLSSQAEAYLKSKLFRGL